MNTFIVRANSQQVDALINPTNSAGAWHILILCPTNYTVYLKQENLSKRPNYEYANRIDGH